MRQIQLTNQDRKQGPLQKESSEILSFLESSGSEIPTTIIEKLSLIRSRFWKVVLDLKDLNVVVFGK